MQIDTYENSEMNKYTHIQIYTYANTHIDKYTNLKIQFKNIDTSANKQIYNYRKHTKIQLYKYTNIQIQE